MNIAFITPTLGLGGYEKVVIGYANELARRGNCVYILCGFQQGELLKSVDHSVNVVEFCARFRNYIFPLVKFLKHNHIDLLYSGFRGYNAISVLAKKISHSKAVIYATQHGFEKENGLDTKIMGKIISHADCQIAVARDIASFEKRCLHIKQGFEILYNPVVDRNHQMIQDESHPWFQEDIPIIAISGRLAKDKNRCLAIRIFAESRKSRPLRLIILGKGPEKKLMEQLVKHLQIEQAVDFMGFVSNPLGYLKHCALLLHTPVVEGFGNIIVESLYVNVPVVITECTGPLEIIGENEEYGICIGKAEDPLTLDKGVDAINSILDHKIEFGDLKQRALSFDVKTSTDRFMEIYDEYRNNK